MNLLELLITVDFVLFFQILLPYQLTLVNHLLVVPIRFVKMLMEHLHARVCLNLKDSHHTANQNV